MTHPDLKVWSCRGWVHDRDIEQLKQRLEQGGGDILERIGYDEASGQSLRLSKEQFDDHIEGFRLAASKLGCRATLLEVGVEGEAHTGWLLIRRVPGEMEDVQEIRVAVVGNVDAGKSTTLGVLTKGRLDDGRGLARSHIFRHRHEFDSGRTSSIGAEILGFDGDVQPVYPVGEQRLSWEQICEASHRLVSFIDLAGHEKYLKSTMFGLTGCAPDYALLVVGANAGLIGMAREHLTLAFALGIPLLLVVSKVDSCPAPVLAETMRQIFKTLKSPACKRVPVQVKSREEALLTSRNLVSQRLCPIFQVSNISGAGLDLLRLCLAILPSKAAPMAQPSQKEGPAEFEIVETFAVPGVGTVVSGNMISGRITLGQPVFLGPDSLGAWLPTVIKGIHRKRVPVSEASGGQSVSFALKRLKRNQVHKGMVILSSDPTSSASQPERKACTEFEAEVIVLFHSTTMAPRYQAMVHSGVVRQTASIVSMQKDVMRTGDRAVVRFRFLRHPEYLRVNSRLVFREGRTKGIGKVTALFD